MTYLVKHEVTAANKNAMDNGGARVTVSQQKKSAVALLPTYSPVPVTRKLRK
jgi:hypothetical protein